MKLFDLTQFQFTTDSFKFEYWMSFKIHLEKCGFDELSMATPMRIKNMNNGNPSKKKDGRLLYFATIYFFFYYSISDILMTIYCAIHTTKNWIDSIFKMSK